MQKPPPAAARLQKTVMLFSAVQLSHRRTQLTQPEAPTIQFSTQYTLCVRFPLETILILCQTKSLKCKRRISKGSIKSIYTAKEHFFFTNFTIQIASSALVHLSQSTTVNNPQQHINSSSSLYPLVQIKHSSK